MQILKKVEVPSNSAGSGGPLTNALNVGFSATNTYSSTYHRYVEGLDWTKPVGLMVHFHGDGAFEYNNPTSDWMLGGTRGLIAKAKSMNMILIVALTPDDAVGRFTWWQWYGKEENPRYAKDLIAFILSKYNIDKKRIWFTGSSGGSQFITRYLLPHFGVELGIVGGGFVVFGGGQAPASSFAPYNPSFKANWHCQWVVGELDDGSDEVDGFNALVAASAGKSWYSTQGFSTDITYVAGLRHDLAALQGRYVESTYNDHRPARTDVPVSPPAFVGEIPQDTAPLLMNWFGGPGDRFWSAPQNLKKHWIPALINRKRTPARMLIVSASMSEMVSNNAGGGGIQSSWPNLIADRFLLPAQSEWGRGVNPNGSDFIHPYSWTGGSAFFINEEVAMHRPTRVGTTNAWIGYDVSAYAQAQPFFSKVGWTQYPGYNYGFGNLGITSPQCYVWNPADKACEILMGPTVELNGAGELSMGHDTGDVILQGLWVNRPGPVEIEVMNLSRSGTRSDEWATWLGSNYRVSSMMGLIEGYNPNLVGFGSWGNDYWQNGEGTLTQATLNSRLDALYARLQVLCPHADFFSWTEPQVSTSWSSHTTWNTFCDWIMEWCASKNILCLDWRVGTAVAGDDLDHYGSDQVHGNLLYSKQIAELTAKALLIQRD